MTPTIRVVEIPSWDAQACFGTHVKNTRDVGAIKIVNVERIADGVVRFEFVAGTALADYVGQVENKLKSVAKALGVGVEEIDKRVEGLVKQMRDAENVLRSYRALYEDMLVKQILSESETFNNLKLYVLKPPIQDEEVVRKAVIKAIEAEPKLILVILSPRQNRTYVEISLGKESEKKVDAREIVKLLSNRVPVRAGGKRDHVTGVIEVEIRSAENAVREAIQSLLST